MSDHTPTPWEVVPSTEHHGPYISGPHGGDICDFYAMSNYLAASVRNGGTSYPIPHQGEAADANAAFAVRAANAHDDLVAALRKARNIILQMGLPDEATDRVLLESGNALDKSEGRS
jgi:hypothetical protein